MVSGSLTVIDFAATLGIPSAPVVATGTVCQRLRSATRSSGIATMEHHVENAPRTPPWRSKCCGGGPYVSFTITTPAVPSNRSQGATQASLWTGHPQTFFGTAGETPPGQGLFAGSEWPEPGFLPVHGPRLPPSLSHGYPFPGPHSLLP